ncbi:MAG: SDR family oxidoreductase [Alphaproteobacteria bacterium]|nr:SDR family oxidoreductase [Alphaproteobacteria bacterium]MBU0796433.1 SDR family oxidoreductase [Alphaproteobacteria bacterium]MBU0888681.1 SDR family oxidoreductase [Alphaproteobacteria bacterium]MBU1813585.1 SDR family oxidoreductase [Alphaproteobacteria bacterium]
MAGILVVTGGSRGIGAATSRMAASRGWDVAVNYKGNEAAAEAVVADIQAAGRRAIAIQGDMAVEADILRLFEETTAALGPITGVVNNAGITGAGSRLEDVSLDTIKSVIDLNVTGALLVAREAVKRLSTRHGGTGGGIVNLSSAASRLGGTGELIPYAASKGAIDTLTIGLAKEVGGEGIRVNAVSPGLIDTDIHNSTGDMNRMNRLLPGVPMGRVGTADEVAEAILWLLSPASGYVTGTIIQVTGGRL